MTELLPLTLAGCLMLIDNVWGGLAALPFDWFRFPEAALGVSFLIGFPAYLLDARSKMRVVVFLPALFLFRWWALNLQPPYTPFVLPWRVCALLIPAAILLQWSKFANPPAAVVR
jgi:hypothetical protein